MTSHFPNNIRSKRKWDQTKRKKKNNQEQYPTTDSQHIHDPIGNIATQGNTFQKWLHSWDFTYDGRGWLKVRIRLSLLTLFFPMFPFDPSENIKKPLIISCFQGDQKGTLGRKGLMTKENSNSNSTKANSSELINFDSSWNHRKTIGFKPQIFWWFQGELKLINSRKLA